MKNKYSLEEAELKNNKANYQDKQIANLEYTNNILFSIYYILAVISIFVIYFKYDLSASFKIIISLLLLVYPFVIYSLEITIKKQYDYIMSFVYGIPYEE